MVHVREMDEADIEAVSMIRVTLASARGATPAQIALAWVLRRDDVLAIPKAAGTAHVEENRAALDLALTDDDLRLLDDAFPPPSGKQPLELL